MTLLTADGTHALVTTERRYIGDPAVPATPVAVIDLTTGTQTGTTLSLIGDTYASPAFTLDGTRALITTSHRRLDHRREHHPGHDDQHRHRDADRCDRHPQRCPLVRRRQSLASGVKPRRRPRLGCHHFDPRRRTSRAAIIDTATGTQIGSTVTINGALSGLRWSTDGTRVFVTTYITTATGADLSIQETVLKNL